MTYSKKIEPVLILNLKPSRRLKQLLMSIHGLAIIASFGNALALPIQLAVFVAVIGHGYWLIQRLAKSPKTIQHNPAQGWQVDDQLVQILPSTVVTTLAIFLHYRVLGQRQHILIAVDALTADDFRQLIVRLKTSYQVRH